MQYKNYTSTISFDEECKIFSGEVINIQDVITFQAESLTELEKAFHDSVDDYIEFCQSRNEEPETPIP